MLSQYVNNSIAAGFTFNQCSPKAKTNKNLARDVTS